MNKPDSLFNRRVLKIIEAILKIILAITRIIKELV